LGRRVIGKIPEKKSTRRRNEKKKERGERYYQEVEETPWEPFTAHERTATQPRLKAEKRENMTLIKASGDCRSPTRIVERALISAAAV